MICYDQMGIQLYGFATNCFLLKVMAWWLKIALGLMGWYNKGKK